MSDRRFALLSMLMVLLFMTGALTFQKGDDGIEAAGGQTDKDIPLDTSTSIPSTVNLVKTINRASIHSQTLNGPRKMMVTNGEKVFFCYSWYNSSAVTLSVVASFNNGKNWTSVVDIYSSTYYNAIPFKSIFIWKGDLMVVFLAQHAMGSNNRLYMKNASLLNWQRLITASTTTICSSYGGRFDLTYDQDGIHIAMCRANYFDPWYYHYSGTSWSSGTILSGSNTGTGVGIQIAGSRSSPKIMYFYCRRSNPGYINMRTSTDNGTLWTTATIVMNKTTDYRLMDCVNINGTYILIANKYHNDDIDISISRDNGTTWSDARTIVSNRGLNSYEENPEEFSVGATSGGRVIYLLYEGSNNEIRMIYSTDWGSNWISESKAVQLTSSITFDPNIEEQCRYFSTMVRNGSYYDIDIYNIQELYLDDYSPRNLTASSGYLYINLSWDPPKKDLFKDYRFLNYSLYRGASADELILYRSLGNVSCFNDSLLDFTPGKYYYGIKAVFEKIGSSQMSNIVSAEPKIPPRPRITDVVNGDLSVTITWDNIPHEVMYIFPVEYYTIFKGNYPDSQVEMARVYQGNTYHDTDIDPYPALYYYTVTYTLMGVGEGKPSDQVMGDPNTSPDPPEGFDLKEVTGGVTLEWAPPDDTGNLPITEYIIYRGMYPEKLKELSRTGAETLSLDQLNIPSGTIYFYSVSTLNRLGESLPNGPIMMIYKGIPSRPRDLIAKPGKGVIELTWSPPAVTWGIPVDLYNIYRSKANNPPTLYKTVTGNERSFTDIVTTGVEYCYHVSAVNPYGEGQMEGPAGAVASWIPGIVSSVSVETGNMTIRLDWEPVTDDGGSSITLYTLYRSKEDDPWKELVDIPPGLLSFIDNGLTNGVGYSYWISASNKNGEGPLSSPVYGIPGADPHSIRTISAKPLLHGASLEWSYPPDGGRDIVDFRVYRGEGKNSLKPYITISIDDLEVISFMDDLLMYGSEYFYAVTALNELGESGLSPVVSVRPYGAPGSPEDLTGYGSLHEVYFEWAPPHDDGGLPLEGYNVYYRNRRMAEWGVIEKWPDPGQLFVRMTRFNPGDEIEVRVTSFNSLVEGSPSKVLTIKIGSTPEAIETLTGSPGDGRCTLSWEKPIDNGYPVTSYLLYMIDEKGYLLRLRTIDGEATSVNHDGLINGQDHSYRISALNMLGESELSNIVIVTPGSVPSQVEHLWIERIGDGSVTLTWTPPISGGGYSLTAYRIYRTSENISGELVAEMDPDSFEYTDTGLENGHTYNYYITVRSDVGESKMSEVVHAIPLTHPSDPMDLRLSSSTDTVTLEWLPPQDNGGIKIEGYLIYKGMSPSEMDFWKDLGPEELSTEDMSVSEGTYHYRIHAYNSMGASDGVDAEVDVPPRIPIAVIIGISAFLVPLLVLGAALLFPYMIKKKEGWKQEEQKRGEELLPPPGLPPITRDLPGLPSYPGTGGFLPGTGQIPGSFLRQTPPTLMHAPQAATLRVLPPAPPTPEPEIIPEPEAPFQSELVELPEMKETVFPATVKPVEPPAVEESFLEPPAPEGQTIFHEDHDHLWSPQMVEHRSVQETENALQMLKELNDLKKTGALTEEEYDISKRRLLRRI